MTEILFEGHVDEIDIADYLSHRGKMPKEARAAVSEHLAKCQECMKALLAADEASHSTIKK